MIGWDDIGISFIKAPQLGAGPLGWQASMHGVVVAQPCILYVSPAANRTKAAVEPMLRKGRYWPAAAGRERPDPCEFAPQLWGKKVS
jgi:hypothetical protein